MTSRGLVLLAAMACSACGLPGAVHAQAAHASALIDTENVEIARKEAAYRAFIGTDAASARYRVYADRERWAAQFTYARAKTSAARETYQRYVAPLLDRNRRNDEQAVAVQLALIARLVSEADAYANLPDRRRQYVDSIASTYKRLAQQTEADAGKVKASMTSLVALGDQAKQSFPARAGDIDKRVGPLQKLAQDTAVESQKVAFEAAKANAGRAGDFVDFVVLGDNARRVSENASRLTEDRRTAGEQLQSLSHSYSKALADMKATYFITVQRWSWNDSLDYPAVHLYTYPRREIVGETFDYFNSLPDTLPYTARYSTSTFFGSSLRTHDRVDPARWAGLGIEPHDAWTSRDDTAEFGYTLSADYFHKYLTTGDGQAQESDWEKVDETMFEDHVDDLGMDILNKPYGAFEDEKITNATPAGLAFVGNPQYGRWQTDERGTSFWEWYGRYRLFSDLLGAGGLPYYYRQDEWNTWSTRYRGRPYYGEDKDNKERYGTHGYVVGSSSRYSARIPEMRRVAIRHGGDGAVGRGGLHPFGK